MKKLRTLKETPVRPTNNNVSGLPILILNRRNGNGRIYTNESANTIIEQFGKKIESGDTVFGEIETEDGGNAITDLSKVTHMVKKIYIGGDHDDIVYADIEFLDTPLSELGKKMLFEEGAVFRSKSIGKICGDDTVEISEFITLELVHSENDPFAGMVYIPKNYWELVEY